MSVKAKKKKLKKVGIFFAILLVLSLVTFDIFLLYTDILPLKYLIIYLSVSTLLVFLFTRVLLLRKFKIWIKCVVMFLSLIFILIFTIGCIYINKTYDFLGKISSRGEMTEKYYVMINTNSNYDNIKDLEGKVVGSFNENVEIYNEAIKKYNKKVSSELKEYDSVNGMVNDLLDNNIDAIILSGTHKETIDMDVPTFKDNTKVIYTIEIKNKNLVKIKKADLDVTKKPFTIYISGIDSYGDILSRSRSDVNMLATINPKTHEILLVSIPRDYYVQLHGISGGYDKLTHAGFFGVDMSINTIQDFMGINIDSYIKVNFSTLIGIVDTIGGVDVYSDAAFIPWTNQKIYINKGNIHMNGEMALAFARERHAYIEGDRHRVQNQQDVLIAIVKKMTSSTALLRKYTELLDKMSSSFETNIQPDDITSLIKHQLDKMPSWTIKSYNVNGFDDSKYTYSYGSQELYVMQPDQTTIDIAKGYINGMKEGKTFAELGIE